MNAGERLYVLPGTYAQFKNWCADRGISPRDRRVVCIMNPWELMGTPHGLWYIKIGTWYDRRDLPHIEVALAGRGARLAAHDTRVG
jgi:hypothetical protein